MPKLLFIDESEKRTMKERADEDFDIQRMRQILTQGEFDDTDGGNGTITCSSRILSASLKYRTSKHEKNGKLHFRKWIKSLTHR